jgi:hypothetical protein
MERDYEDIWRLDELSDQELRDLVREQLAQYPTIDVDSIVVRAEGGVVLLSGRVGTEQERRIAEHILTDVIGVTKYENEILVDPIHRDEEPEAIDDHLASLDATDGEILGKAPDDVAGPEAEHLVEDLDAQLYGTHDLQSAIERGTPWVPPDTPTPEGLAGQEGDPGSLSEDH